MNNKVADNWYETFFTGINCEMWERAIPSEWSEKEALFLADVLAIDKGSAILDIPSGFGRIAIPLARIGYGLMCVDISERFLSSLSKIVRTEKLPIQIVHGNILTLGLNGLFDGAICMGNSFGYFDFESMKIFVKKVVDCLKPGSRFIINSGMLAESILRDMPVEKKFTLGDLTMHINNEYIVADSYMVSNLTYNQNGREEKHSFKHYVYTLGELNRFLDSMGLKVLAVYKDIEKNPYEYGDQQAFIVSEKFS